jgi:flavoprotein
MYSVTWSLSDLRLAAWQMPIDATDSSVAIDALRHQVRRCEENGIAVLCCPEGAIGGLADYVRDRQTSPSRQATSPTDSRQSTDMQWR